MWHVISHDIMIYNITWCSWYITSGDVIWEMICGSSARNRLDLTVSFVRRQRFVSYLKYHLHITRYSWYIMSYNVVGYILCGLAAWNSLDLTISNDVYDIISSRITWYSTWYDLSITTLSVLYIDIHISYHISHDIPSIYIKHTLHGTSRFVIYIKTSTP